MHAIHWAISFSVTAAIAGSQLIGCTTDNAPDGTNKSGTGGSTGTGTASSTGTGTSTSGGSTSTSSTSVTGTCAILTKITSPTIATFDNCTLGAITDTSPCSVAAIGATLLFGGTFAYNDGTGNPTFSVVNGHAGNAIGLTSTQNATAYGGGMGLWTNGCLNATSYSGVTFWTRGIAPNSGTASITLFWAATTPVTPAVGVKYSGTCPGDLTTCTQPKYTFPVTDTWTQVHAKWADFKGGAAVGTPLTPDGGNLFQFQWDIGLLFTLDAATNTYVPVPAPYELQLDDFAFE
jgi:hypothetical protein